jgi:putative hemolysin
MHSPDCRSDLDVAGSNPVGPDRTVFAMVAILYIAGLAGLLALSAFFAGAETAIVGIPYSKVHRMVKEGRWGANSLRRLKRDMRKTLTAILICNSILSIVITSLSTIVAVEALGSIGVGVAIGAIFLLILTIGEIFPKTLATAYMERISTYASAPVEAASWLLSPLIGLLQAVPNRLLRKNELGREMVSEMEMHDLLELGIDENVLEKGEVGMIKKVLLFNDIPVRDVMTPVDKVAKIEENTTVENAVGLVSLQNYTRYPIVDKSDRIIGSLRAKRLLNHAYTDKGMLVVSLADKPLFIDSEIKIDDAFDLMKFSHQHIAYVTDEEGKVLGVVTTEDVLEELVGEY